MILRFLGFREVNCLWEKRWDPKWGFYVRFQNETQSQYTLYHHASKYVRIDPYFLYPYKSSKLYLHHHQFFLAENLCFPAAGKNYKLAYAYLGWDLIYSSASAKYQIFLKKNSCKQLAEKCKMSIFNYLFLPENARVLSFFLPKCMIIFRSMQIINI